MENIKNNKLKILNYQNKDNLDELESLYENDLKNVDNYKDIDLLTTSMNKMIKK